MLRFIQHNLTSIGNVEFYPIVSLIIFSLFFLLVLIRVFFMSKDTITDLSEIPLNDSSIEQ
jgi:fructose-specific phosphotransferase system IIC component